MALILENMFSFAHILGLGYTEDQAAAETAVICTVLA
jgi:hypothetical protein